MADSPLQNHQVLAADCQGVELGAMADGTRVLPEQTVEFVSWMQQKGHGRFLDCTAVNVPKRGALDAQGTGDWRQRG